MAAPSLGEDLLDFEEDVSRPPARPRRAVSVEASR